MLAQILNYIAIGLLLLVTVSIEKAVGPPVLSSLLTVVMLSKLSRPQQVTLCLFMTLLISALFSAQVLSILIVLGIYLHLFIALPFLKQRLFIWLSTVTLAICISMISGLLLNSVATLYLVAGVIVAAVYVQYRYTTTNKPLI